MSLKKKPSIKTVKTNKSHLAAHLRDYTAITKWDLPQKYKGGSTYKNQCNRPH